MEQVAIISSGPLNRPLHPPPLPPKTRRPYAVVDVNMSSAAALECHQQTPPSATSTTVYVSSKTATNQDDLNTYHSFPEVEPNSNTANVVSNKQIESNSGGHVVKIQINSNVNDGDTVLKKRSVSKIQLINVEEDKLKSITRIGDVTEEESSRSLIVDPQSDSCIRINVGTTETEHQQKEEMIRSTTMPSESLIKTSNNERNNPYFFYSNINNYSCSPASLVMSSGQCSPSDTLDSGTCSDLDSTPPPLPKKKSNKITGVSITVINGQHNRASSLTSSGVDNDSDDNESNISCDSLNSGELNGSAVIPISDHNDQNQNESEKITETDTPLVVQLNNKNKSECNNVFLPSGLLQDIRDRSVKLTATLTQISDPVDEKCQGNITKDDQNAIQIKETKNTNGSSLDMTNMKSLTDKQVSSTTTKTVLVNESTYEERKLKEKQANIEEIEKPSSGNFLYDADRYYKFHLNENVFKDDASIVSDKNFDEDDDNFAGYKDFLGSGGTSSTIRSAKGTVRGVKNRVRAGIATFLQIQNTTKSYREKDAGKVVVYTTTMGIVRDTYQQCVKVKQILRTHLVKFEERDVFMSSEYQTEIRDRMHSDQILIPQLFVDGQHIGDAEAVERLNECGELRKLLKPYKSADACSTCQVCGGYRLLPCPVCNGSKKSVHRNHFTTEFVALKCMNCDEVGLVKCYAC